MTRRSRGTGKQAKARRRKAAMSKRGAAPRLRRRSSSTFGQEDQFKRLRRERDEALLRETANSEILRLISKSPGELEPVFRAMLDNAVRICEANFGNIYRYDGDGFHLVASHNTPAALVEHRKGSPYRPSSTTPMSRAIASKTAVHVLDAAVEPAYIEERDPGMVAVVELAGMRTYIAVPLLKETELIGVLTLGYSEPQAGAALSCG